MTFKDDATFTFRADPAYALNDVAYVEGYDQCVDPEPPTLIGSPMGAQGLLGPRTIIGLGQGSVAVNDAVASIHRHVPFGFGPHGDGDPMGDDWGLGPLV